jgi:ATP-dependent helicase HrpA
VAGNELPLEYRFEPGMSTDGITVLVPSPLLNALGAAQLSWLIPGWRLELVTELLRSLPKQVRKAFVPVPEHAARAAAEADEGKSFYAAMSQWIARNSGTVLSEQELEGLKLPDHLRFNLRIVGVNGAILAEGRDLAALRRLMRARESQGSMHRPAVEVYRAWDFGELPIERSVERRGLRFTVYPTLRDRSDGVALDEASSEGEANASLREGMLRLAILALPEQFKYARKRFAEHRELILLSQGLDSPRSLPDALAMKCFEQTFLSDVSVPPRNDAQFMQLLDKRRSAFGDVVDRVLAHTLDILRELRGVRQRLSGLKGDTFGAVRHHVGNQLSALAPEDFPMSVPALLWPHLPRLLKAVSRRLEKVPANLQRDAELASRIAPGVRAYAQLAASADRNSPHPELDRLQWMVEELRVSIFAQDLGTAVPVSEKRVAEQVEKAKGEVGRF